MVALAAVAKHKQRSVAASAASRKVARAWQHLNGGIVASAWRGNNIMAYGGNQQQQTGGSKNSAYGMARSWRGNSVSACARKQHQQHQQHTTTLCAAAAAG